MDEIFGQFPAAEEPEDADPAEKKETDPELKQLIDSAGLILQAGILTKSEGQHILEQIKRRAAEQFPDKMEIFQREYEDHLRQLIAEFCIPEIE